jgi:hypothetical protein
MRSRPRQLSEAGEEDQAGDPEKPEGIMVPVPGIFSLFGHADANPLEFLCYATHPSPNIQHTGGSSGATQTVTLPA